MSFMWLNFVTVLLYFNVMLMIGMHVNMLLHGQHKEQCWKQAGNP